MNKLIDLNFAPGIKAKDINSNFELLHQWLKRERLRDAGWGIAEGFDLSRGKGKYHTVVSDGVIINRDGEELIVEGREFFADPLDVLQLSESVIGNSEGVIELRERPFSSSKGGFMNYDNARAESQPPEDEILVVEKSTGKKALVKMVKGNKLTISSAYDGHEMQVTYQTTHDRIDSILLNEDGTYEYVTNIESPSPSHADLKDYDGTFVIGMVYWTVGEKISASYFTDHRDYRSVFVDKDNRLYLYGRPYKEVRLFFEEPDSPQENDLWYDKENNLLMIYRETDGVFGWVNVNQIDHYQLKQSILITEDKFPKDAQTFIFPDDRLDLRYIPNSNALEIIIDNATLMSDQYEEIVQEGAKEYLSAGIGFKLKDPLDRPTVIQVNVNHIAQSRPLIETFQRGAVFVFENYIYYNNSMGDVFETEDDYVIGESQLEVFLNGRRLAKGKEYIEMVDSTTEAGSTDRGKHSKYFKILAHINNQDIVAHKVSRWVWSFDQLDEMIHEIENIAKDAQERVGILEESFEKLQDNFTEKVTQLEKEIENIKDFIKKNDFMKKTDPISMKNLPVEIQKNIIGKEINTTFAADGDIILEDVNETDYLNISYISAEMSRILMKDIDYLVIPDENNLIIELDPTLAVSEATVYVTGFKRGIQIKKGEE